MALWERVSPSLCFSIHTLPARASSASGTPPWSLTRILRPKTKGATLHNPPGKSNANPGTDGLQHLQGPVVDHRGAETRRIGGVDRLGWEVRRLDVEDAAPQHHARSVLRRGGIK